MLIIKEHGLQANSKRDFNTSHVNVNLTAMHLMKKRHIDFNTSHVNVNRILAITLTSLLINFNTSHVNVNHFGTCILSLIVEYFNTSHVNVNHNSIYSNYYFNYISIHLMLMLICRNDCEWYYRSGISIHLMLMLIKFFVLFLVQHQNFNTSHVNVNRITSHLLQDIGEISIHLMLMLIQ